MTETTDPWHEGTCNRCKLDTRVAVGNMPGMPYSQAVCYPCALAVMAGCDPFKGPEPGTINASTIEDCFQMLFGIKARHVEIQVCEGKGVDLLADVLWDHWMGEPENPSLSLVTSFVQAVHDQDQAALDVVAEEFKRVQG